MTKHKWYKEIKAWADGAEIECQSKADPDKEWQEFDGNWGEIEGWKFRIKSQPKEPQYLYVYKHEADGISFGYKPHGAVNMWQTKVIGKIKLEVDDD